MDTISVRVKNKKEVVFVDVYEAAWNVRTKHVECPEIVANISTDITHNLGRDFAVWSFKYNGKLISFAVEEVKDKNTLTIISDEDFAAGLITLDIIAFK